MISLAAIPVHALEIRGAVAGTVNGQSNLINNSFSWNPQNFAGFYYDIDHDLGSDNLTTVFSEGYTLSGEEPYGIVYETNDLAKIFSSARIGMKYGKLIVRAIDSTTGTIALDNKDNPIYLRKNWEEEIIPGIYIREADNDTLRYYIYKNITNPGTYEIRGAVAGTVSGHNNLDGNSFAWTHDNFAGFYYDVEKDLGTERLKTTITDDNKLNGGNYPYGIMYSTRAQNKAFECAPWGSFRVIGFMGEEYFARYNEGVDESSGSNIFFAESTDRNSLSKEQLERVLINEKIDAIIKKDEALKLKEGYELTLKGVNDEGKMYVVLFKNGKEIDSFFLNPSRDGATELDKTYYYRNPRVGTQNNLVTIAVHFSNANKVNEWEQARVNGIWQISDTPFDAKINTQYEKMTIRSIDAVAGSVSMDNQDHEINLTRKIDIELMPGIRIRTGDNDTLRYYIYKTVTI